MFKNQISLIPLSKKRKMVSKLVGYIIAAIGLVLLAVVMLEILIIPGINPSFLILAAAILIIVGVFLTLGKSKYSVKQASEEVPIYIDEGKKRKIVGYKREK